MKSPLISVVLTMLLVACGSGSDNRDSTKVPVTPSPPSINLPYINTEHIGFESAPVRPIAIATELNKLLVANTSNNSVEIFSLDNKGELKFAERVSVGLEPVSIAINGTVAWVVNHLSDSVSLVDISQTPARILRTLLVGDEPRDIVFANNKAFITTAHRGQQRGNAAIADVPGAGDPQLHKSGIGRADIWVFDSSAQGNATGGKPIKIVSFFGDTLRGLAVSPDNSIVYAGVLNSGNQTTAVHEAVMCFGYEDDDYGAYPCQVLDEMTSPNGLANGYLPGGRTAPGTNVDGEYQPWTSMIVKFDPESGQWRDSKGRNFSNGIRFNLPDLDVFGLNTTTLEQSHAFSGIGTTLFNLATNPVTGDIFVSNTEANNATRFEGPGIIGGSTVQGDIARSRITVISPTNGQVKPRHLNRHIDYKNLKGNGDIKHLTLSTPTQIAISNDGKTAYVAALGSNKIAVIPTKQLVDDSYWDGKGDEFAPAKLNNAHIELPGGPSGILLNDEKNALYVFTRYDNALVKIDLATNQESQRITMPTFEPDAIMAGRFMLYDALRSSSNGESSCASCHIFGDTDHLSWNLGNPDASNNENPQPFPTKNLSELGCLLVGPDEASCQLLELINGNGDELSFASMKGPMGTQTLRGMQNHGHMHWRGDRSVGYFGDDIEQTLDEKTSFKNFIVAFEGLLGLDIELPTTVEARNKSEEVRQLEEDVDKFADFMLSIALPPNPIRGLDNSLSTSAQIGEAFFHGERRADGAAEDTPINGNSPDGVNCEGCHGVDHSKGFYGTRGEIAHGGEIQILKVPQLRNLYTRVGMFGLPDRQGFLPSHTKTHQGDQIRGFGFLHDGATDQLLNFLKGGVFDNGEAGCPQGADERHGCHFNAGEIGIPDEETRQGLVDYMMEFDNDIAPIVGQQVTLNATSAEGAVNRIELLEQRASTPFVSKLLGGDVYECDLIVQGVADNKVSAYFYDIHEQRYISDSKSSPSLSSDDIRAKAKANDNSLTFTCVIPGKGWQLAIDRDLDGTLNSDEEN